MHNCIKTRTVLRALHKLGFEEKRQRGSHMFFEHPDGRTTVIPLHDEIRIKLLTKIIKDDLKIEREKFFDLIG